MKRFIHFLIEKEAACSLYSYNDIKDLEKFGDALLKQFGIDIEFTKHFQDRMGDDRNKPCIQPDEIKALFQKISTDKGKKIKKIRDEDEAVLVDIQKNLNLPFVLHVTPKGDLDITFKTIMRKKDFRTPDKKAIY